MKRYSLKCVNHCLSSDENGLTSYLACLRTCDDEDQDGDEDVSVTDDNENGDGDESVEDDNDDDVNNDYGDVVYY